MNYYLGIDGGGTKTECLLVDETGQVVAHVLTDGCSYKEIGVSDAVKKIMYIISRCIDADNEVSVDKIRGMAIGLPCYGESPKSDVLLWEGLKTGLGSIPFYLANDVEVGWAGSLALKPGINIVAGTGSIAFGKSRENVSARSGGWSTFFGDEGSCYWLGRRTMELFTKQADGRVKEGELYHILKDELKIRDIQDFIERMEAEYAPNRSKVASLQRILFSAAKAGDASAIKLYQEAADELFMLVYSLACRLNFIGNEFIVSYSGGLFHASEFVIPYLKDKVEAIGGKLVKPIFTPVQGAVLLAIHMFSELLSDRDVTQFKFINKE